MLNRGIKAELRKGRIELEVNASSLALYLKIDVVYIIIILRYFLPDKLRKIGTCVLMT